MSRRLLAIAPVDHPGGAEIYLLRLLAGLRSDGWEVTLTTPGHRPRRDQAVVEDYVERAERAERLISR